MGIPRANIKSPKITSSATVDIASAKPRRSILKGMKARRKRGISSRASPANSNTRLSSTYLSALPSTTGVSRTSWVSFSPARIGYSRFPSRTYMSIPPTPRASTLPSSSVKSTRAFFASPPVPIRSTRTRSPAKSTSTRLSRAGLPRLTLTACFIPLLHFFATVSHLSELIHDAQEAGPAKLVTSYGNFLSGTDKTPTHDNTNFY